MTTFNEWQARYPEAARELLSVLVHPDSMADRHDDKSEAWAQQQVRLAVARQKAYAWRNNVGATKAKCDACGARLQPVRYGLANDSSKLNAVIKSHDLILAIPRIIRPEDVGCKIAQFGSIEVKHPGWRYSGTHEEEGQATWGTLIRNIGGFSIFSTGQVPDLSSIKLDRV